LGPHFRIGHSYVTPQGAVANGTEWFRRKVETEIVPLLEEYWYDQPGKVEEARSLLLADL
jgi:5-methylcytosine-specific restriction protein B